VIIYANDSLGHMGESNVSFLVDTTLPHLEIMYPENKSYNHSIVEMNYTLTNKSAIDQCWYNLNEGVNQTISCWQNITSILSQEGSNRWYIYSNNSLGSLGYNYVNFMVDTISP
jgi:hypothetical protein